MSGIAGIIRFKNEPIKKYTLISIIDSIRHRGAHNDFYWTHDNIGIAHCRLSIIDLSKNTDQPIIYDNNRYVIY